MRLFDSLTFDDEGDGSPVYRGRRFAAGMLEAAHCRLLISPPPFGTSWCFALRYVGAIPASFVYGDAQSMGQDRKAGMTGLARMNTMPPGGYSE